MISSLVPFPGGAQVVLTYSMPSVAPIRNRLWFFNRQPPTTATQLQALSDGVAALWTAEIMPLLAPELSLNLVEAFQWDVPGAGLIGFTSLSVTGGASSPSHSANVAIRVRFDWAEPAPSRAGSNFVPGIPRDAIDTNTIVPTFANALRLAYADMIDLAANWGPFPAWRWVNASLQTGGAARTEVFARRVTLIEVPSIYVSPRRKRARA